MKKAKRALALFLALCMILSMNAVLGSAIAGRHFSEVNEADADMAVTFTSEIYRNAGTAEAPDWVPTTVAAPGEDVKVRVTLQTSSTTNMGDFVVVWDPDMFTDSIPNDKMALPVNEDFPFANAYKAASFYVTYVYGAPQWGDLINNHDTETETYITQEMYDKYKNSWAYIHLSSSQTVQATGEDWLFEIPLTVKDTATTSDMAFGIVEDALCAFGISEDYDLDMVGLPGISMGYDSLFDSYVPFLTTNDATLSTSNSIIVSDNGTETEFTGTVGTSPDLSAYGADTRYSTDPNCAYDAALTADQVVIGYETGADTVKYYAIRLSNAIVMFDLNGGSSEDDTIFDAEIGSTVNVPAATKTGYHLTGWQSDNDDVDDLAADAATAEVPATDVTFTAQWAPNIHTLTINYVDGDGNEVAPSYVNANAEYEGIYDVPSPTVTGYHLVDAAQSTVEVIMDDQDETVNVVYELNTAGLTINYLLDGTQTALQAAYTEELDYGDTYSVASPAITGYHLVDAAQETITGTMGNDPVEIDVFYAPNEYNVIYKIVRVDGTIDDYDTQAVAFGDAVQTIALPEAAGKQYSAWLPASGETPATMPADDVTLFTTEQWIDYTLTVLDPAEEVVDNSSTFHYGDEVTEAQLSAYLEDIVFEYGYEFDKWVDENGDDITFPIVITADTTVKAEQKPEMVSVYWIPDEAAFDPDDDTTFEYEQVAFGGDITYRAAPAKDGYTFAGWYCDPDELDDLSNLRTADNWAETVTFSELDGGMLYFAHYTPNDYTLTVNYVMADGNDDLAPATYTEQVAFDSDYSVASPAVEGYTPDTATVEGTMDDVNGKTETVTYSPNEYTLTVNYVMADGKDALAPEAHTEQVVYNTAYSVASPAVTGYTPDVATAEGTMDDVNGKEVTVTYSPNPYTLTVNYQYEDGSEAAPSYSTTVNYNADYSVVSPAVSGYTPDVATVNGTMDAEGKTETVTYLADGKALTIHYQYEDGTQAAPDYEGTVAFNGAYDVASPAVTGYTPDFESITGTMTSLDGLEFTVTYSVNSYPLNITYVMSDGNDAVKPADVVDEMYAYNTSYSVASPAVEGYTPDIATAEGTMGIDGATVTVTYSPNAHTVTWIVDGDEYQVDDVVFGDAIVEPAAPAKEGYDFAGWTPAVASTVADEDYVYTAQFEAKSYEVKYYVKNLDTGATTTITRYIAYGSEVPTDVYEAADGYTFHGWFEDAAYETGFAPAGTMPANVLELYGYISTKAYVVTFDLNGGNIDGDEGPIEDTVSFMGAINAPGVPVKEGYTFTGWTPDLQAGAILDTPATRTYTATWEENPVTITFYASQEDYEAGTVYESAQYVPGETVDPVADPVKEGNTFSDWIYYSADDDSTINFDGTMPAHDVYAIAVYNVYHLDITYVMSDGSEAPAAYSETVEYNDDYSVASPEVEGYTADIATVEGTMPAEDVAVTVTYTPNEYALDITYVMADGSEAPEAYSAQVTYNTAYSVASPELEGYTADIATVEGTMDDVNGKAVTVTYNPNTYTLTINYVDGDGNEVATAYTATLAVGASYSQTSPIVTGYTLADQAQATVAGTMGAADVTINVVYNINTAGLTINYLIEGTATPVPGVSPNPYTEELDYGDTYSVASPEVTGYHLVDTAQATIAGTMGNDPVTETVYYAPNAHTVTWIIDGEEYQVDHVVFGDTIVEPTVAEREGYTLSAWTPEVATTAADEDYIYNATWEANEYTLTINYVDGDGNEVATAYTAQVAYGADYSQASPDVENMHLVDDAQATVAGTMGAADVTVNVVYALDEYTLTINYVDGDGNEVATAYTATLAVGADYSQASPEVENMHLVDDAQATVAGTMGAADVTVNVVYALDEYTLTINYVDGDGNEVATAYTATLAVGADYSQTSPDVENMHLVDDAQATVAGTMGAADVTINVVYALDEYTLTINYVDGDGNEVATAYTATLAVGADYSQASPEVENMHLVDDAQATVAGTMGAADVTVNVVYALDEYTLTINYVDGDGNEVATAYTATLAVGADYSQTSPVVTGYTLADQAQATVAGTMGAADVTINVVYNINTAGLTIHYVKEGTTTPVAETYTQELDYGDAYSVTSPEVAGYHFADATQATISGTMGNDPIEITVEYAPNDITITYTDSEGPHTITGKYGDPVTVPTPAEDEHNEFAGWVDENGDPVDFPTTFPVEDVTIEASYNRIYPKLIARNDAVTTVDRDNHIVYGFADEDGDVYVTLQKLTDIFLDVEGDGYMVITPAYTFNDKGLYGTGAVVTVYDNYDNQPVAGETFTVVVFGDINGDGRVTSTDTTAIRNEISMKTAWSDPAESEYNYYMTLAADVNGDGRLTSTDTTAIRNHVACLEYIDQNPEL